MTEIHDSARRHGVADADIRHAVAHAVHSSEAGHDPRRALYLGPDTAGNMLEVIVMVFDFEPDIAIHAMRMRAKYRIHLPKGGSR